MSNPFGAFITTWLPVVVLRLLQEFVEMHGSGLEVIYTLSGYLKDSPQIYHISLVSGLKLAG